MKNKKVICAGHICLDVTPVFPPGREYPPVGELLAPGGLIRVENADVHTGGSVANTGIAMKILGNDVRLMGKTGADPFGRMIGGIAQKYGCGGLIEDPRSSTSYSIVLAVPGTDRVFLHHPGANDAFGEDDVGEEALKEAGLFHFGYPPLMKRMYENGGRELAALFRKAKNAGCATSLDLAAVDPESGAGRADWKKILASALPYVDFFAPSIEELAFMLDPGLYADLRKRGGDATERPDIGRFAAPLAGKCLSMGCRAVLIKCGLSGMYLKTASAEAFEKAGAGVDPAAWGDFEGRTPCFKAEVVRSATGAGDVSAAAFLTAVLRGYPPGRSMELAAAEGACAVTTYDALSGILPLEQLEKKIADGWERME